jgi:hypothetical protein
MRIESPARTKLQQISSTANEIVGTSRRESLTSGQGNPHGWSFSVLRVAYLLKANTRVYPH